MKLVHAALLLAFFQISFKPCYAKQKHNKGSDEVSFYHFLPFGAGQFANGENNLGITMATSQVLAFGYHLYLWDKAGSISSEAVNGINERQSHRNENLPNQNSEEWTKRDQELQTYLDGKNKEMDLIRNQSLVFFGIFGALWIGGIVQSIVNIDSDQDRKRNVSISPNKSKHRDSPISYRSHQIKPKLSFDLQPFLFQKSAYVNPEMSVLFDLKLEF